MSTGPIDWPIANTTVNTAIAGPHAVFGSDVLIRSVMLVGTENIAVPKKNAERIIAGSAVLQSGIAAPMLITKPTAASTFAADHRERGTRQTIGASIVATPSVPQVSATLTAEAPRDTIHAITNVM